jgi:Flp pilus assembly protein protease CpaA
VLNAGELVNDNSISGIALAFFSILIGGVVTIIVAQIQAKAKANEAAENAIEAAENAKKAAQNTTNISNGFASGVGAKLDRILLSQEDTAKAIRDHLAWHLNKETPK